MIGRLRWLRVMRYAIQWRIERDVERRHCVKLDRRVTELSIENIRLRRTCETLDATNARLSAQSVARDFESIGRFDKSEPEDGALV